MRRTILAMTLVACAAPGFAANEAPVSEYLNDPSYRTPLLTSPAAIAANGILDQFFAQMGLAFTAQTSVAPFSVAPFKVGAKAQAVQTASALSTSSRSRVRIGEISPLDARGVEREEAKKLHASVEIGSSFDSPWEAWENREEAVTDEYRDADR